MKHLFRFTTLIYVISIIAVIGLVSCKPVDEVPPQTQQESSSDKSYHLTLSNGYNTSDDYPLTKELASSYTAHLNSCPVSLKVRTYEEYRDQYLTKIIKLYPKYEKTEDFAGKNVSGQHVRGFPIDDWPSYFIFLEARPNPHEMMATYFHELGHYKCTVEICPYCKVHGHKHVTELHAIVNELESAIEYNFPQVMETSFNKYKNWLRHYDNYKEYADAVLTLQSSPLWDDVEAFAAEHNLEVPKFEKSEKQEGKTIRIIIVSSPRKI